MPTAIPQTVVNTADLRKIQRRLVSVEQITKRALEQVDLLLSPGLDMDDEDDLTQERYPPRRKPSTSTRTLLGASAVFEELSGADNPDIGPVALVERARRNVEKLTQHRDNLDQERAKTTVLISQWQQIARALDNDGEEEIDD